ncbi:acetylcholinesterase [Patella vulgata]|uniref:acetylcholinesterase n=1 Tax=Patella vulgata TaxID=6465 RepID=UPI0021806ED4|nr:acetylcholinesterase [Patella vulgata]
MMSLFTHSVLNTVLLLCVCVVGYQAEIINTTTATAGVIKGKTNTVFIDDNNITIVEYLGIPYAEPPIGKLRFQHSILKSGNASDVFEAFEYGPPCYEFTPETPIVNHSEDCLSLNIFTPSTNGTDNYPVMIFIYCGAFLHGKSSLYDGKRLAAYGDVVVVTMNYRYGPFGFLSTGDSHAPGNSGTIDQQTALKWVKDNIDSFGGNSSMVTIFGGSSNPAGIMYHILFGNQSLFQRAISHCGSVNGFWTQSTPDQQFNTAKRFAMALNCSIPNNRRKASKEILNCLTLVKAEDIWSIASEPNIYSWVPRFDLTKLNTIRWPQAPHHMNKLKDVYQGKDLLLGVNGYEGHFRIESTFRDSLIMMKNTSVPGIRSLFRHFVKGFVAQMNIAPDANSLEALIDAITNLYTNAEDPDDLDFNLKQFTDFLTDTLFVVPAYRDAVSHAYMNNQTKTYLYEYNHVFPFRAHKTIDDWLNSPRHGGVLGYVFGLPKSLTTYLNTTEDQINSQWPFSKVVMDHWTNFAKSGNPNLPRNVETEWKEYTNNEQEYLYFPESGNPMTRKYIRARLITFWQDYVPKLMNRTKSSPTNRECNPSSSTQASVNIILLMNLSFGVLLIFKNH